MSGLYCLFCFAALLRAYTFSRKQINIADGYEKNLVFFFEKDL